MNQILNDVVAMVNELSRQEKETQELLNGLTTIFISKGLVKNKPLRIEYRTGLRLKDIVIANTGNYQRVLIHPDADDIQYALAHIFDEVWVGLDIITKSGDE